MNLQAKLPVEPSPETALSTWIDHPRMAALFDYWTGRCAGAAMPTRAAIDPVDFAYALGNITLIDLTWPDGAPDFHFRLVGSRVNDAFGRDLAGLRLADVLEHFHPTDPLNGRFFTVASNAQPHYAAQAPLKRPDRQLTYSRLILPLSASDAHPSTVHQLLCMIVLFDENGRET